jgi:hypothetical protein
MLTSAANAGNKNNHKHPCPLIKGRKKTKYKWAY